VRLGEKQQLAHRSASVKGRPHIQTQTHDVLTFCLSTEGDDSEQVGPVCQKVVGPGARKPMLCPSPVQTG
jgi:hypothetical protein